MYRKAILTIGLVLLTGTAALAQFPPQPPPPSGQGNEQERAACQPDVIRFCKAELNTNGDDVFAILGCLQRNRARLSAACRHVLESHGQ